MAPRARRQAPSVALVRLCPARRQAAGEYAALVERASAKGAGAVDHAAVRVDGGGAGSVALDRATAGVALSDRIARLDGYLCGARVVLNRQGRAISPVALVRAVAVHGASLEDVLRALGVTVDRRRVRMLSAALSAALGRLAVGLGLMTEGAAAGPCGLPNGENRDYNGKNR
ncbi:MAG: hypothetical protein AAF899_10015 [Pseudomonadota bacterium]